MDKVHMSLADIIKLQKFEAQQATNATGVAKIITAAGTTINGVKNVSLDQVIHEQKSRSGCLIRTEGINYAESKMGNMKSIVCGSRPTREFKKPVKDIILKPLDPCTSSLDEIMEVVENGEHVAVPERRQGTKRNVHVRDAEEPSSTAVMNMEADADGKPTLQQRQYSNMTAYRAIGFLSQRGMIIEVVIGRLENVGGDRSHLWRCIITCGAIKGIADSVRKVVAREIASSQFLAQLGDTYKGIRIPRHETKPEMFIDPRVFHNLEKAAGERILETGHEVRVKPVRPDAVGAARTFYTYVCTYYVGTKKFKAENVVIEYAKILAARDAYIDLTGRVPSPTGYFTGEDCENAVPNSAYNFKESEVFQTVAPIENDGHELPDNLDEVKIEMARREVYDNFKKSKKDEEDRRRNMPVDVQCINGFSGVISGKRSVEVEEMETDSDICPQSENIESPAVGKGRGRGKIMMTVRRLFEEQQ